jgi:hypothetical protein
VGTPLVKGKSSRLGISQQVQFGVYLRASSELTWKRTVKQAGSVPMSIIGSICKKVRENLLAVYFRVYSGASNEVHFIVLLNAA